MRGILAALAVLTTLVFTAPAVADDASPYAGLDQAKVAEVVRLSALLDQLPQKSYPITIHNANEYTAEWEVEILPWFAYEGISDPVIPPTSISYYLGWFGPKSYIDGYVFHVLGLSACETAGYAPNPFDGMLSPVAGPIFLNGRFVNPVSPWYQEPDWLSTLVHELGHSQGICAGPSPYVESSTQIATMEVLAAMVNSGNTQALPALLYEYRAIVEGALYYEAIRDSTLPGYDLLLAATDRSAKEAARHAASRRFWQKDPAQLRDILYKYEWVPYLKLRYGVTHGALKASAEQGRLTQAQTLVPSGHDLVLDDFAYFLAHADEIVAEAANS